jgi:outer membrane receptor protein involved in Fe transport
MLNLHRLGKSSILIIIVGITCLPCIALAQDEIGHSARTQSIDEQVIAEIIVTATRREASVQSVPLSVSVLTNEDIERLGATGFSDYARTVPGVSFIDQGWGGEKHVIRGISSSASLPEINPTTTLYLDEVPIMGSGIGAHYHADPMLVDIERIEVLRGPQGTLFGASSMGGAIRIITAQPDVSDSEGFLSTVVSSYDGGGNGYELHGMYNMPLNDGKAAIRAVGYYRDMDGFIDNLTTGINNVNTDDIVGARLSGTALLSDNVSITGRIAYQDRESAGIKFEEIEDGPRLQSRLPESSRDEWTNYNIVIEADFEWATLLSSTSYLDRSLPLTLDLGPFIDILFGISNPLWTNILDDTSEFIQEVRLVSDGSGQFNWVAGVYYQDQEQDWDQDMPSPGLDEKTGGAAEAAGAPDNIYIGRYNYTMEQLALYGETTYAITDRIELIAGARWFDIERDFTSNSVGILAAGSLSESGASSESGVTPKIGLNFAYNDDLTLYATAAEGFRAGGPNDTTGSNLPECEQELRDLGYSGFPFSYDSDSLRSYELGTKTRWLDGRASLNAAVYHIEWSDMQTQRFLDCGIVIGENAGDSTVDGAELEFVIDPTDSFNIILAASYTDATLKEDVPNLGGSKGDRIPGVPRFTGNVGLSYFFPAFGRRAFIRGDYQHVSNSYTEFDPAIRHELPDYQITNLRIGMEGEQWTATLFAHNVFDERGILTVEDSVLRRAVTATPPRTIGISASWTF